MEIGGNILHRRNQLGITLSELSKRSSVSAGMLSDIENGRKSPTIRTVSQIADALGVTISELVDETPTCGRKILRVADRHKLVDPETGVEREELAPHFRCRGIEVVLYRLPARTETSGFQPHSLGVGEHITILRGAIECYVGEEQFELGEGDSASYEPNAMHGFRNLTDDICELLLVIDHRSAR